MRPVAARGLVVLLATLATVSGCGGDVPPTAAQTLADATAAIGAVQSYHLVIATTTKSGTTSTFDVLVQSPTTFEISYHDGTRVLALDPSMYEFLPAAGGWGQAPPQYVATGRLTTYADSTKLARCLFSRLPSTAVARQTTLNGQPVIEVSAAYSGVEMSYDFAASGRPFPMRITWHSAAYTETRPVDPACKDGTWPGANVSTLQTTIVDGSFAFDRWGQAVVTATPPPPPYAWRAGT